MNRRFFLLSLGLLAASGTVATAARRQGVRPPRIVTTKDAAYLLGAVEPVLAGKITKVSAAPGGRWVLAIQDLRPESTPENREPFGEQKLWLYDALRRKLTLLHRVQDDPDTQTHVALMGANWFPGASKAVISILTLRLVDGKPVENVRHGLVDVERSAVRWLTAPSDRLSMVMVVPGTNLLMLEGGGAGGVNNTLLSFVSADGTFSPLATVGQKNWARFAGLSADGLSALFDEMNFKRVEGATRATQEHQWFAVRLRDASVTPLPEQPKDMLAAKTLRKPVALPLQLLHEGAKLTGTAGRDANTNALWLEPTTPGREKKYTRALVTAEADNNNILLADLSAVLYIHDGALYASPIVSLDRVAFEKLQRELAMSHAKQVGLGLMMYAQDYDENFPHDPATMKDAIFPYLKDREILADFVYTYTGPTNLNKIDTPSTTPLGHIPVPGGRMVVYADGHVKLEM